ncbi:hypothetical protein PHISP_00330 [Aspergillus sp. HF37]|nr:hypothetical protein PHISP_00330 [Aspergillus sp. HF37]
MPVGSSAESLSIGGSETCIGNFGLDRPLAIWNGANRDIRPNNAFSLRPRITARYTSNTTNETHEPSKPKEPKEPPQSAGNAICDVCHTNPTTEVIPAVTLCKRRFRASTWSSFCDTCYESYTVTRELHRREMMQEHASRKKRVEEMLERVRNTEYTQRVDMKYANAAVRYAARGTEFFRKPPKMFQKNILDHLKEELDIKRIQGMHTVAKERVDAMDWRLWCLHPYLDIDV